MFAPCYLFNLTDYLKNNFVPSDKPEVLSSCSAEWLSVHQLCPNQKCNKLGFPNRHQEAICPDSAEPTYFSMLHFSLGTSTANHPYLCKKQSTSLKLSFCSLANKKILILTGSHHQKKQYSAEKFMQDSFQASDSYRK